MKTWKKSEYRNAENCIKIVISGGKSLVLRSQVAAYGSADADASP